MAGTLAIALGLTMVAAGALGVGNRAGGAPTPEASATPGTAATPTIAYECTGGSFLFFDNWNGDVVTSGAMPPTFSTAGKQYCLASIATYHWNGANGKAPGTIGLIAANGASIGPWPAQGSAGQLNAPNVNWTASPTSAQVLLDGSYRCSVSDPATWSSNKTSAGQGFCRVWVYNAVPVAGLVTVAPIATTTSRPLPTTVPRPAPTEPDGPNGAVVIGGLMVAGIGIILRRPLREEDLSRQCDILVYLDRIEFESELLGFVGGEVADDDPNVPMADVGKRIGPQWDIRCRINDADASWREMTWRNAQVKSEMGYNCVWSVELPDGCGKPVEVGYHVTVQAGPGVEWIAAEADSGDADLVRSYLCDGSKVEERLTVTLGIGSRGGPGNNAQARFTFVFAGDLVCGVRPPGPKLPKQLWQDPTIDPGEQRRIANEKLGPGPDGPKSTLPDG